MTDNEAAVAHWVQSGDLPGFMRAWLHSSGIATADTPLKDKLRMLAPLDQFHGGGLETTEILLELLAINGGPDLRGLDVGCGMCGPLRWAAHNLNCAMVGVDLTPDMIEVARLFSVELNLPKQCEFIVGDACAMEFRRGSFDFAIMMAGTTNISNRSALSTRR